MIFNKKEKTLTDEIQFLSLFLTSIIIITVQLALLLVITLSMISSLQQRAEVTADEAVAFLREPLYTLDDIQAKRIGEALLSSGRISEIVINSNATGEILSASTGPCSPLIPVSTREIMYKDILLGSVSLHFSDRELRDMISLLFIFMAIVMITVVFANFYAHKRIIRKKIMDPVQTIIIGLNKIAGGNYETTIPLTKYNDIDMLVSIINDMSNKIRLKNIELLDLNNSLEDRVTERTLQLSNSLHELHQAQDKLIETGKLSALGLLSAGMAHELNTPLGAIISSNNLLISIIEKREYSLPQFFKDLDHTGLNLYLEILKSSMGKSKFLDIDQSERQKKRELKAELEWKEIPNSSEVADLLGELGVLELNSDLLFLLKTPQNTKILNQVLDVFISRKMSEIVQVAGQKAATVLTALGSYISADPEEINENIDLNETIDHILTLMNNMIKHGVKIIREYSPVFISGSKDKLGQVWMNIIRNAVEAMNYNGILKIKTEKKENRVIVYFEDNGSGISEEIKEKIFTPFFSTKKKEKGMGLGLGISKKIIENHNGFISFESKPGETIFIINLPAAKE
ncbi:MAG TPA: ATP-binding protein [Treponemataceae bacterium]|nr:ATP-binding protein [Treponemataceae bacterium]